MVDYTNRDTVWYAMKTTFKRELKAKAALDENRVENFIAMRHKQVVLRGKKSLISEPAIHNLIFMRADGDLLMKMKSKISYLHNRLTKDGDKLVPIIVSDRDMAQFIKLTQSGLEKTILVDLTTTPLAKGTKVRITGGEFEGFEGVLMKVKGARDKRVVLNIEGVVALAMATVPADLIEKI